MPSHRFAGAGLRLLALLLLAAAVPSAAWGEYAVLRTGQRVRITGYQLIEGTYFFQLPGGWMELPAADVLAIEPEDTFGPIAAAMPRTPFDSFIRAAALRHRVDAELVAAVIAAESNFDPRAVSSKNARGLMQLMPATVERFGVADPFDPRQNIEAGTRYLRELLDRYPNDLSLVLAAYNAGPERVAQYGGVPPFRETRDYIARVTAQLKDAGRKSSSSE